MLDGIGLRQVFDLTIFTLDNSLDPSRLKHIAHARQYDHMPK